MPAGGWLGTKRSSRSAPRGAAAPPTYRRTASFPGQAVPARSHTHTASTKSPQELSTPDRESRLCGACPRLTDRVGGRPSQGDALAFRSEKWSPINSRQPRPTEPLADEAVQSFLLASGLGRSSVSAPRSTSCSPATVTWATSGQLCQLSPIVFAGHAGAVGGAELVEQGEEGASRCVPLPSPGGHRCDERSPDNDPVQRRGLGEALAACVSIRASRLATAWSAPRMLPSRSVRSGLVTRPSAIAWVSKSATRTRCSGSAPIRKLPGASSSAWPARRPRAAGRRRHPLPCKCRWRPAQSASMSCDRHPARCRSHPPTTTGDSVTAVPAPPGAVAKPPAIRRREAARRGA